jgi:hypothetical protein
MKKSPNWIAALILSIVFVGVISFSIFLVKDEETDLDKNGVFTVGTVVRTYRIRSRGNFIEYKFEHNKKMYTDHQPVKVEVTKEDCYTIKYSESNPEHCMMILTDKKKCN